LRNSFASGIARDAITARGKWQVTYM